LQNYPNYEPTQQDAYHQAPRWGGGNRRVEISSFKLPVGVSEENIAKLAKQTNFETAKTELTTTSPINQSSQVS
jgi:hypothetical protein